MTTYTLSGFSVTYDQNDNPSAVGAATLQVVFPNNQAFINYSLIDTGNGDLPEVDLGGSQDQGVLFNGVPFSDNPFNEDFLGSVTTNQGTHIVLAFFDANTDTDYIFQIGGAPLNVVPTLAGFEALNNSITNLGVATGAFAPGQDILLSSLAGVQVSAAGAPVNQIPGTPGDEQLFGTLDNDNITTGGGVDYVLGSIGNDTINVGANGGTDGYVDLDYSAIERGVDVVISGFTGTGSVDKADAGTDSLLGLNAPMDAGAVNGGLGVYGGMNDDSFALNLAAGQWMQVRGGEGTDSYAITGSGDVRLRLDGGFGAVSVNLNTGTVIDDGFGNTETITGQVWEVQGGFGNDTLIGSAANEAFITGEGNDVVNGGGGFDRVRYDRFGVDGGMTIDLDAGTASGSWFGGAFTDSLTSIEWARGSNLNDTFIGSSADERFDGRGGTDSFTYNGGNDTISDFSFGSETVTFDLGTPQTVQTALDAASSDGAGGVVVNFGGGNSLTFNNATVAQVQTLNAASNFNDIIGTSGPDALIGTDGDDRFVTGDNDGSGDYIVPGLGNDLMDFSDIVNGFVSVDYSFLDALSQTITVNIDGAANTGSVAYSGGDTDTFVDVVNPLDSGWLNGGLEIRGTAGNDSFTVTTATEQWVSLQMGDGTDSLTINGSGLVRLNFRDGTQGLDVDLSTGTIANDGFGNTETIAGTNDVWEVYGSAFNDSFTGSDANESFRIIGGNDALDGGAGFDRLRLDSGAIASANIDAEAAMASGALSAGGTFDAQFVNFEHLRGSTGNDTIRGSSADERLEGRGGTDSFVYTGGNDTISDFAIGSETLTVRSGATQVDVDAALAAASNDGLGNAVVDFGGGDSLTFSGLSVADIQVLIGNAGGRVAGITASATTAPSLVTGGIGDDTLSGAFNNDTLIGGDGNDVINAGFGFDSVNAGEGDDSVVGLNGFDTMDGGAGDDTLRGNAGNDSLLGGAGDDRLEGGIAFDFLSGGAGNDLLIAGDGFDTLDGGTGADTLIGNSGNDLLQGGDGDDLLEGGIMADTLEGGAGNDLLRGGSGGDTLLGGDGDDRLEGNGGADRLEGGAGNDVLIGGIGVDTFVFMSGSGADRVADLKPIDMIEIDATLLGGGTPVASDLIAYAGRTDDGFLILDFGNGDTLTFTGITNTGAILDDVSFI